MSDNETVAQDAIPKSEAATALTAQRIRKRELDRRAQRTARVKTKNRIAYLEQLVETFRDQDAHGANTSLIKQLEGVSAERDGFKRFLQSLDDSIRSHLAGTPGTVALNPPGRPRDQSLLRRDASGDDSACPGTQSLLEPASMAPPVDANAPLLEFGSEMDYSIDGSINLNAPPSERPIKTTANPISGVERPGSSPEADGANLSLASHQVTAVQNTHCPPVITPPSSCACTSSSSRTRRLADGTEVSFNIWRAANQVLSKPARRLDADRECDSISDDIIVRAILEGWDSVDKTHPLTPFWKKIRYLDEIGFMGCSTVERFGILWIVHLLIPTQHDAVPVNPTVLPKWYRKPSSNHPRYVPGVEYLPWPGVRESLNQSHHRYCQNLFWNLFKEHVRIIWPFDFRDCYTQNVQQGRYHISSAFEQTIRNSRSWTMERDFFGYFPELHHEIPIFLDIIPPPPRMGAWEPDTASTHAAGRTTNDLEAASYVNIEDQLFGFPLYGPPRPTGWNVNDYDQAAGYRISYDDLDAIGGGSSHTVL
ncbi:hypothetical protein BGZ61DRAFT_462831 [Ilyonectria robusta]|uniref:uncharacterized protein n=1 Tax=Ilyonectria robusta TaxID=1079257 RepID=UPI001E8E09CD|nr:uncharacterized protein BGZ61DRAFT_462831 [Ilyonectria robusta]KAH8663305.1 hypothetical protein BGZ61DRAFT_462831 [Ilyonectria robusta]